MGARMVYAKEESQLECNSRQGNETTKTDGKGQKSQLYFTGGSTQAQVCLCHGQRQEGNEKTTQIALSK